MFKRSVSILTTLAFLWPATGLAMALHCACAHEHHAEDCDGCPHRSDDHGQAPAKHSSDDCPVCYLLAQTAKATAVDDGPTCRTPDEIGYVDTSPHVSWAAVACGCEPIIPRAPPAWFV
jgi:hypothetical protein